MTPELLPWIVLFLPLGAAVVITLFTQRNRELSAALSIGAVVTSFVLSVIFRALVGWEPVARESTVTWLSIGDLQVDFGLRFDPLSLAMLLLVTGVASVIHIYSWGYMKEDRSVPRYFAGLSLFTFSMLGIVLASNFLQLFIFWELVGVSSYLLIGFWYERPAAADAGKRRSSPIAWVTSASCSASCWCGPALALSTSVCSRRTSPPTRRRSGLWRRSPAC